VAAAGMLVESEHVGRRAVHPRRRSFAYRISLSTGLTLGDSGVKPL
jgi:hypothetical protein